MVRIRTRQTDEESQAIRVDTHTHTGTHARACVRDFLLSACTTYRGSSQHVQACGAWPRQNPCLSSPAPCSSLPRAVPARRTLCPTGLCGPCVRVPGRGEAGGGRNFKEVLSSRGREILKFHPAKRITLGGTWTGRRGKSSVGRAIWHVHDALGRRRCASFSFYAARRPRVSVVAAPRFPCYARHCPCALRR